MRRSRSLPAAALVVCLALAAGSASAGELAELHRDLQREAAGSTIVPLAPGGPATGIRQLAPVPQRAPLPAIERIGYEALACRGVCEAFTVIIAADGSFEYVGEANVERLGRHTGRLDSFAVEQLMRYVDAIDYASLSDTYASPFADVQTTYTMVDYGGSDVKVIQNQGGSAPVTIWALGELIVSLLEDAHWD